MRQCDSCCYEFGFNCGVATLGQKVYESLESGAVAMKAKEGENVASFCVLEDLTRRWSSLCIDGLAPKQFGCACHLINYPPLRVQMGRRHKSAFK